MLQIKPATPNASLLLFSSSSLVLSSLLISLAYIKHRLILIKKELLWYLLVCLCGGVIEVLLVNIAGAWAYDAKLFFNIPVWMPLFCGIIGTTIIVFYEGFSEK